MKQLCAKVSLCKSTFYPVIVCNHVQCNPTVHVVQCSTCIGSAPVHKSRSQASKVFSIFTVT